MTTSSETHRELPDLSEDELARLREELDTFEDRVYWLVRQIPEGKIATYGQIALLARSPRAARVVGQILEQSLGDAVELPWHRVINAKGGISHRGDLGRAERQKRWLRDEDVVFDQGGTCDLTYRWEPDVVPWENEADDV